MLTKWLKSDLVRPYVARTSVKGTHSQSWRVQSQGSACSSWQECIGATLMTLNLEEVKEARETPLKENEPGCKSDPETSKSFAERGKDVNKGTKAVATKKKEPRNEEPEEEPKELFEDDLERKMSSTLSKSDPDGAKQAEFRKKDRVKVSEEDSEPAKSRRSKPTQASVIGVKPTAPEDTGFQEKEAENAVPHEVIKASLKASVPADSAKAEAKKVRAEVCAWPPPLPVIADEKLRKLIFTHRSAINASSVRRVSLHNGRMKFLGGSILGSVVASILYDMYPLANEGGLTKMKNQLVNKKTLFDIGVAYNLHTRLHVSAQLKNHMQMLVKRSESDESKAVADVFEAYVAGVYKNRGYDAVMAWLRELYAPLMYIRGAKGDQKESESQGEITYLEVSSWSVKIQYKRVYRIRRTFEH